MQVISYNNNYNPNCMDIVNRSNSKKSNSDNKKGNNKVFAMTAIQTTITTISITAITTMSITTVIKKTPGHHDKQTTTLTPLGLDGDRKIKSKSK